MPYIKPEQRLDIDEALESVIATNAGDLNYAITVLVNTYISEKGKNYARINEAVGALECAKLELYRRLAAPYEDSKIAENGDVKYYASDETLL